jgi:hypothetical protein
MRSMQLMFALSALNTGAVIWGSLIDNFPHWVWAAVNIALSVSAMTARIIAQKDLGDGIAD